MKRLYYSDDDYDHRLPRNTASDWLSLLGTFVSSMVTAFLVIFALDWLLGDDS